MTGWFGTSWGAPFNDPRTKLADVPVGEPCLWCDEQIAADDSGVVTPLIREHDATFAFYHVECFMRSILGSTGHQLGLCPCFGGTYEGEPDTMSIRDAARAAWALAQERRERP